MDWSTAFVLITTLVISCSYAATDKLESNFYESESEIKLTHGFGTCLNDGRMVVTPRGTLTVKNFKGPKFTIEQVPLSKLDVDKLQELAKEDGYYFLNASIMTASGESVFHTFAPASTLLEAGLTDIIYIHVTPTGTIFSISYAMSGSGYPPLSSFPVKFNTSLIVHHGEYGPVPDTAQYLEKLEMEKMAKERGEDGRDNRSFLAKYWMYIVPLAVIVLLSSAQQPEGG